MNGEKLSGKSPESAKEMNDDDWENIPITIFKFTRKDVVFQQLETAISMWFVEGDVISIHALASAALTVVHDVGAKEGKPSNLVSKLDKEQRARSVKFQNFFKHADRDPDATLHFAPEITEIHIYDAILTYINLYGRPSMLMRAFSLFYILHRPHVFPEQFPSVFDVSDAPELRKLNRRQFLEYCHQVFTEP